MEHLITEFYKDAVFSSNENTWFEYSQNDYIEANVKNEHCRFLHVTLPSPVENVTDLALVKIHSQAIKLTLTTLSRLIEIQTAPDSWIKIFQNAQIFDDASCMRYFKSSIDKVTETLLEVIDENVVAAAADQTFKNNLLHYQYGQIIPNPKLKECIVKSIQKEKLVMCLMLQVMNTRKGEQCPALIRLNGPIMETISQEGRVGAMEHMLTKAMVAAEAEVGTLLEIDTFLVSIYEIMDKMYKVPIGNMYFGVKIYLDRKDDFNLRLIRNPYWDNETPSLTNQGIYMMGLQYLLDKINKKIRETSMVQTAEEMSQQFRESLLKSVEFMSTVVNSRSFIAPLCHELLHIYSKIGGAGKSFIRPRDIYDHIYLKCLKDILGDTATQALFALETTTGGDIHPIENTDTVQLTDYITIDQNYHNLGYIPKDLFVRIDDKIQNEGGPQTSGDRLFWIGLTLNQFPILEPQQQVQNNYQLIQSWLLWAHQYQIEAKTAMIVQGEAAALYHHILPQSMIPSASQMPLFTNTNLMSAVFHTESKRVNKDALLLLLFDSMIKNKFTWERTLAALMKTWLAQMCKVENYNRDSKLVAANHGTYIQSIYDNLASVVDANHTSGWTVEEVSWFLQKVCNDLGTVVPGTGTEMIDLSELLSYATTITTRVLYDCVDKCDWIFPVVNTNTSLNPQCRLLPRGLDFSYEIRPVFWLIKTLTDAKKDGGGGGGGEKRVYRYEVINTELWRGKNRSGAIPHTLHDKLLNNSSTSTVIKDIMEWVNNTNKQYTNLNFQTVFSWGIGLTDVFAASTYDADIIEKQIRVVASTQNLEYFQSIQDVINIMCKTYAELRNTTGTRDRTKRRIDIFRYIANAMAAQNSTRKCPSSLNTTLLDILWSIVLSNDNKDSNVCQYKNEGYILREKQGQDGKWKLIGCVAKNLSFSDGNTNIFQKLCTIFWNSKATNWSNIQLSEEGNYVKFATELYSVWLEELMSYCRSSTTGRIETSQIPQELLKEPKVLQFLKLSDCMLNRYIPIYSGPDILTTLASGGHQHDFKRVKAIINAITKATVEDEKLKNFVSETIGNVWLIVEVILKNICLNDNTDTYMPDEIPVLLRASSNKSKPLDMLPMNERGIRLLVNCIGYLLQKRSTDKVMKTLGEDTNVIVSQQKSQQTSQDDAPQAMTSFIITENQLVNLLVMADSYVVDSIEKTGISSKEHMFALHKCGLLNRNLHLVFENMPDEQRGGMRAVLDLVIIENDNTNVLWQFWDYLFAMCFLTVLNIRGAICFYALDTDALKPNSIFDFTRLTKAKSVLQELIAMGANYDGPDKIQKYTQLTTALLTECQWMDTSTTQAVIQLVEKISKPQAIATAAVGYADYPDKVQSISFIDCLVSVISNLTGGTEIVQRKLACLVQQILDTPLRCSSRGVLSNLKSGTVGSGSKKIDLVVLGSAMNNTGRSASSKKSLGYGATVAKSLTSAKVDYSIIHTPTVSRDESFVILRNTPDAQRSSFNLSTCSYFSSGDTTDIGQLTQELNNLFAEVQRQRDFVIRV